MKAINLLPPELRATGKRAKASAVTTVDAVGGTGPFFVLSALALCVVAMAIHVMASNTVKEREARLATVTAEHQAATGRAAQLKPYGDFQAMADNRLATVRSLAHQRFDWEQGLRDIARALPAKVTLESLEGSVSGGVTAPATATAAPVAPSLTLRGCTIDDQTNVADVMSRMRNVRGVTRVTLVKSEKPDTQPGEFGPCGAGSNPVFELRVFFERSEAGNPPAVVPAPGAAPVTPAPTPAAGSSTPPQPASPSTSNPTPVP